MTTAISHAVFTDAVNAAIQAPSMHNTQPWRFRLHGNAVEVLADESRRLAVADPTGWAVRLACGAAIFNLRTAFAAHGAPMGVSLLPDREQPLLLARLTPEVPRPATPTETALYAAIPRRRSNRFPFVDTPVPLDCRDRLVRAARDGGARLDLLTGPVAADTIVAIVAAADRYLHRDQAYRAEVNAWTRDDTNGRGDGITRTAGGPAPTPTELLHRRDFGGRPAGRDYEREPLIAVLGTVGDSPVDQLIAGQALQQVLLTATDIGLAASMISQPIEVPEVRDELRQALPQRYTPQMLLRIGYAVPAPASPRRPVSEVIVP